MYAKQNRDRKLKKKHTYGHWFLWNSPESLQRRNLFENVDITAHLIILLVSKFKYISVEIYLMGFRIYQISSSM